MRRVILALVPLFLLACDRAATDPVETPSFSAGSSERYFPFGATLDVCGELVDFSGYFHPIGTFTPDGNGGFHFTSHINAQGTGIGQASGATWTWADAINAQGNFQPPQATFTSQQAWKLIGRGQAANMLVKYLFHVTVTPTGVVNVTADNFEAVCK